MELVIDAYGTKIRGSGERIIIDIPKQKNKDSETREYPASHLEKIIIMRPASLTTQAVELALKYNIDITYLDKHHKTMGRFYSSKQGGLVDLRRAQTRTSTNEESSFSLSKLLVKGKSKNQAIYLEYLGEKYHKNFTKEIKQINELLAMMDDIPLLEKNKGQLRSMEARVAERYFFALRKLFSFPGRKPGGRDRFNSTLNYGYSFLYNELERVCLHIGLDPYMGLFHAERYGQQALVFDLVEEFRVPIVDSVIFPLFIEKKIDKKKFFDLKGKGNYWLSNEGKFVIARAILNRMQETTTYNKKTYTLKYIIEQQVRLLGRHFLEKENFETFNATNLLRDEPF
jgi:CRISPR-associated protein Cas1